MQTIKKLRKEIEELNEEVMYLKIENERLKEKKDFELDYLKQGTEFLRKEIKDLIKEIEDLKRENEDLIKEIEDLKRENEELEYLKQRIKLL